MMLVYERDQRHEPLRRAEIQSTFQTIFIEALYSSINQITKITRRSHGFMPAKTKIPTVPIYHKNEYDSKFNVDF